MHVIDSHTGGEPTRVILSGGPDLGDGPLADRARRLATDHADFIRSVCAEPRGQVAMVCALLVEPTDPDSAAGVIYFDAAEVLGMCGHGTIGLVVTLAHMGRIAPGAHRIDTPVGPVGVVLHDAHTVTVTNVESRRITAGLTLEVPGLGRVTGDVAYGGNLFYIVDPSPVPVDPANIRALTDTAAAVRAAVHAAGSSVDHVIFHGSAVSETDHGRSFVLCPDDAYDRSPCGTGCSARLACLAADGKLAAGTEIVQHSVIGSSYRLSWQPGPTGGVIPSITGAAHVMAEATLIFDPADPFRFGITP